MKRILALVCAAVMTVGMAVNVMAEPSPSVKGAVQKIESATDAKGNKLDLIIETVSEAESQQHFTDTEQKAVDEIQKPEEFKKLLGDQYEEGMQMIDIRNIHVPEGVTPVFPLTVTFQVAGVTKDSKVAVLHFKDDTKAWEVVPSTVGEGTVTAVFNSLSPVAFVVDAKTAAAGNGTGSTTGTASSGSSTAKSPKTGESNVMTWVLLIGAVAAAGMAVTCKGRKRA